MEGKINIDDLITHDLMHEGKSIRSGGGVLISVPTLALDLLRLARA